MYQITQDMQMISSKELTKAFDEAEGISADVNIDNIYSSEKLGRILDMAGKLYYAQVDIADNILAERHNISITRSLSVGMTGYQVRSETMWGMPVGIAEGNLYIDIDLNNVAAISVTVTKTANSNILLHLVSCLQPMKVLFGRNLQENPEFLRFPY